MGRRFAEGQREEFRLSAAGASADHRRPGSFRSFDEAFDGFEDATSAGRQATEDFFAAIFVGMHIPDDRARRRSLR